MHMLRSYTTLQLCFVTVSLSVKVELLLQDMYIQTDGRTE